MVPSKTNYHMDELLGSITIFILFIVFAITRIQARKEKVFVNTHLVNLELIMLTALTILSINIIFTPLVFGSIGLSTDSEKSALDKILEEYILINLFLVVVLAPIAEEFLFRRLIYAYLRQKIGVPLAFLISIGLFSAIHFELIKVIHTLVLGSFYTFIYERTQSVLASIIAHALNNLFAISAVFFVEIDPLLFIEFNSPWRYLEFIIAILLLLWSLRHIYQITQSKSLQKSERPIDTAT